MKALAKSEARPGIWLVDAPEPAVGINDVLIRVLRTGIFIILSIQGPVGDDDRRTSMRLFAHEVIPELKAYAKEIDLPDPFERTPGSVKVVPGTRRAPVVDRGRLAALGLK